MSATSQYVKQEHATIDKLAELYKALKRPRKIRYGAKLLLEGRVSYLTIESYLAVT